MRAIVRDTYGSPDVLELPHQALGFRVQAYGVTSKIPLMEFQNLHPSLPRSSHFHGHNTSLSVKCSGTPCECQENSQALLLIQAVAEVAPDSLRYLAYTSS